MRATGVLWVRPLHQNWAIEKGPEYRMRNLLLLLILFGGGFVLVAMYVAPTQPALRAWYLEHACKTLDNVSPQICDPIRKAGEEGKV